MVNENKVILELKSLKKSFRSYWTFLPKPVLHKVDLEVFEGEAFGFLGPNGAGKTTTIKCILGLLNITAGEVLFEGRPVNTPESRSKIGYLPEHPYFYDHLSVLETLEFFASLYGMSGQRKAKRVSEVLELTGLNPRKKDKVKSLSKGWQQRVGIAQAILDEPRLLILDEPFSGLDPKGRREVRELVLSLKSHGTTIILSSHILSDVEDICDRISIMKEGVLESVFRLDEISELFGHEIELKVRDIDVNSLEVETAIQAATSSNNSKGVVTLTFNNYEDAHVSLATLMKLGATIEEFDKKSKSLEEIFVHLTEGVEEKEVVSNLDSLDSPTIEEHAR